MKLVIGKVRAVLAAWWRRNVCDEAPDDITI